MKNIVFIYALCHPITNEIRYIGKTNSIRNRMIQHKYSAYKNKGHFHSWKKSIYEAGLIPLCIILEEVSTANWEESEIFWISYFTTLNARLLNATSGGRGVINLEYTPEIKRALSEGQKGRKHTEETKEKIRKASSQYKHTEETKAKLSLIKSNPTDESRRKMSESQQKFLEENPDRLEQLRERCRILSENNKGRIHSEESKLKMSLSQKGKPKSIEARKNKSKLTDEQVIEILKLLAEGELTNKQIAQIYNVFPQTIYQINKNMNYTWIPRDSIKEAA